MLGLLLALLAIVLPFTWRMLEERELASSEENVASELMRARVRAQESGKPVEVLALEGAPWRIAMRYFDTTKRSERDGQRRSTESDRPDSESFGTKKWVDPVRDSWWEESALDASVHVTSAENSNDENGSDRAGGGGSLRIAVFLPDGSILFAAALLLMHDNGLHSRVSVDPWTGQPAIERSLAVNDDRGVPCPDDATGRAADETRRELSDEWKDQFENQGQDRSDERGNDRDGESGSGR